MSAGARRAVLLAAVLTAACSAPPSDEPAAPTVDSAALADSLAALTRAEAGALVDSAKATLATLLAQPASATFDSVVVIQPPAADGRLPAMAACGRIGGRPGIGGSRTPVRFIYQGKWTAFVEEADNRERFEGLWAKLCAAPGSEVVLDGR